MTGTRQDAKAWNDIQKEFYNSRDHRRMWYAPGSAFVSHILERFLSFTGLAPGARILEVGCGAGRYSIPLLERGFRVTGLDISEKMLERLRAGAGRAGIAPERYALHCGSIDDFDGEKDGLFDAVVGFNVLHHLYDFGACFCRARQIVKSGGMAAFVEPNARNPMHVVDTLLDRGWKAEKHKEHCLPSPVGAAMRESGFARTDFTFCSFFPPFLTDRVPALTRWETKMEQWALIREWLPFFIIKGFSHERSC